MSERRHFTALSLASASPVDDVGSSWLAEMPLQVLALGRIRSSKIDEALFAWLWERLGGGGAYSYLDIRNLLIDRGLLRVCVSKSTVLLHVDPAMRTSLAVILEQQFPGERLRHVDYCIAEYYRDRVLSAKGPVALARLVDFVRYSREAANLSAALTFILSPPVLRKVHECQPGQVLRALLTPLVRRHGFARAGLPALNLLASGRARNVELAKLALLAREMGLCHYDAGNYRAALSCIARSQRLLASVGDSERDRLRRSLALLRGHCLREMNRPIAAVRSYLLAVEGGLVLGKQETFALAFLASELHEHDSNRAQQLATEAFRLATGQADAIVRSIVCLTLLQPLLRASCSPSLHAILAQTEGLTQRKTGSDVEFIADLARTLRREISKSGPTAAFSYLETQRKKLRRLAISIAWHGDDLPS